MLGNAGNFMRMEPKIQSVENAAGTGNAEKRFQVARMVPHHGGYAVAPFQAEFGKSGGQAARPSVKIAIGGAGNGLVRLAGDDLDARKDLPRALQDGGQRQR